MRLVVLDRLGRRATSDLGDPPAALGLQIGFISFIASTIASVWPGSTVVADPDERWAPGCRRW